MKYAVRITRCAYEDLEAAAVWWATHRSADQALRWHDGFIEKLDSLGEMPESHSLARENEKVEHELRELHYGLGSRTTHRAVFRIMQNSVEVIAVRHVAQRNLESTDF